MSKTKIEWATDVWNPVTGCSPVSEGCKNCYARRMATRLAGRCGYPADEPFRVTVHPDKLEEPLKWRKPRRVFVCSMGDLFHEDIRDFYIAQVFGVMAACPDSIFMLLTKRPARMNVIIEEKIPFWAGEAFPGDCALSQAMEFGNWPLRNVWLGVSVENQTTADERVPILLYTPAAVRFVSYEPALGPVDFRSMETPDGDRLGTSLYSFGKGCGLDWIIAGGETGPGARPAHPDWFRSVRDQCQAAGVPFFFKQWGEWYPNAIDCPANIDFNVRHEFVGDVAMARVGRKAASRFLDGREWNEWPEVQE